MKWIKKIMIFVFLCFMNLSLNAEVVKRGAFSLSENIIYLTVGDVNLDNSQYIDIHRQIARPLELQPLCNSSPQEVKELIIKNLIEMKDEVKELAVTDWRAVCNLDVGNDQKEWQQSLYNKTGIKSLFSSKDNCFNLALVSVIVKTSGIPIIRSIRYELLLTLAKKKGLEMESLSYSVPIFAAVGNSLNTRDQEELKKKTIEMRAEMSADMLAKMDAACCSNKVIKTAELNNPKLTQEDIDQLFIEIRKLMPKSEITELKTDRYIAIGEKSVYALVSHYLGCTSFTKQQVLDAILKVNVFKNSVNVAQPISEIAINLLIAYHVMDLAKIQKVICHPSNDACEEILLYPKSGFFP